MEIKKDKKVIITGKKGMSGCRDTGWDLRDLLAGQGITLRRDRPTGDPVKLCHGSVSNPLRTETIIWRN